MKAPNDRIGIFPCTYEETFYFFILIYCDLGGRIVLMVF